MFKNALLKASFLLIVGEVLNLVINILNGGTFGIWHVFGANMITVVGLAQLLTYGLMKMSIRGRIVLVIALATSYPLLLAGCLHSMGYAGDGSLAVSAENLTSLPYILYYLLFYMDAMAPTMSWLIIATLASVLFVPYVNSYVNDVDDKHELDMTKHSRHVYQLATFGMVLLVLSILIGGFLLFSGLGMSAWLYDWLVTDGPFRFYFLPGLPMFLVRHTPNYLVFNTGLLAIAFGLLQHRSFEVELEGKVLPGQTTISRLGKYSFSIFVYGHVFALIPIKLPLYWFAIIVGAIVIVIAILVNPWETRAKGIGSLEWLLVKYVAMLSKPRKKQVVPSKNVPLREQAPDPK